MRRGLFTSELYVMVLAPLLGTLYSYIDWLLTHSSTLAPYAVMGSTLLGVAYGWLRTWLKAQHIEIPDPPPQAPVIPPSSAT